MDDHRVFPKPNISLLVAVRNESDHIEDCIASLIDQSYPASNLEVIILDGESDDNSVEIIKKLIENQSNFSLVTNHKRIQSAAWNLGLDICHGEIISIVSGHVIPASDYVSKAVETMQRTNADMVGGTVRSISSGKVGEAIAFAMSSPFGVGGARFRYTEKEEETDSVFMGFCRREIYEKIGKFDEELVRNQDDEFSYRLRKAGGKIICNPQIKSYYYSRSSYRSLWKQYFQYGFYKVRVLQKHPKQMSLRQFVPPLFVFALVVSVILSFLVSWGWVLLVAILCAYVLANLSASLITAQKHGWKHFFRLPLAFATLHLSYGLGFLLGLLKFWNRWGDKVGKTPRLKLGN